MHRSSLRSIHFHACNFGSSLAAINRLKTELEIAFTLYFPPLRPAKAAAVWPKLQVRSSSTWYGLLPSELEQEVSFGLDPKKLVLFEVRLKTSVQKQKPLSCSMEMLTVPRACAQIGIDGLQLHAATKHCKLGNFGHIQILLRKMQNAGHQGSSLPSFSAQHWRLDFSLDLFSQHGGKQLGQAIFAVVFSIPHIDVCEKLCAPDQFACTLDLLALEINKGNCPSNQK